MKDKHLPHWQQRQDPRWQKKRLEIFQRDDFTCQLCGTKDKQLQVHHRWYVSGRQVWEYPEASLVTLCETCHEVEGEVGVDSGKDGSGMDWELFSSVFLKAIENDRGWGIGTFWDEFNHNYGWPPEAIMGTLLIGFKKFVTYEDMCMWRKWIDENSAQKRNIEVIK